MSTATHSSTDHAHADNYHPHVVPLWQLLAVFGALLVLTVVTVAATWVDLGDLNVVVALGIALVKATLVAAFFMHLYWDSRFNTISVIAAVLFVVLLIVLCIMDAGQYKKDQFSILKSDAAKNINIKADAGQAAPAPAAQH